MLAKTLAISIAPSFTCKKLHVMNYSMGAPRSRSQKDKSANIHRPTSIRQGLATIWHFCDNFKSYLYISRINLKTRLLIMASNHCIVYVLTNEAMPGFIKIGTTRKPILNRMQQLFSSGVPVPFKCHYAAVVEQHLNVERRIHRVLSVQRVNDNREFFELVPEAAADIIRLVEIEDVTPQADYVETEDDTTAIKKLEQRAAQFNFKMVGIPKETILRFKLDDEITCQVIDNRRVRFLDQETSLSAAVLAAQKQRGINWKSAQGAQYWTHNGQTLVELRQQAENED
ncbi:GIY-YIG nuclease family protein [Maritalea mediterranea]|uniref:GIY-YIG nuclease family protein n=1 Tax=Maritalea mediterranea TaxID=2909667 RepID=A0ABS9EA63_9HYPH|nr:GIY-YIG nuclease family protein [Maritalea mediterranea]MCF4099775.1 GIY-YIG nuclease family protein [Maritalea mediterranea]